MIGVKPVPPTREDFVVSEQAFIIEHRRPPYGSEHWPLIVALSKQRMRVS